MEVATSVINQLRTVEDARAVLRGLRELVALAGTGSQADVSRLANAGAPEHLLVALERHIGNPEIQKVGCAALAILVGGRPAVATWVVSQGAVQTMRASARTFESDAALSLHVSRALLAVASAYALSAAPSSAAAIMGPVGLGEPHRADAADVLLGVLERDPCDLTVALISCKALCHVVASDDAARAAAAALATLYVHRTDALMCRVCCRLLHILCAASEHSRAHVLATTAAEDIAASLRRHPSKLEVVTEACAALERLGVHPSEQCGATPSGSSVVALFFRVGVYTSLLSVMHRHPHFASLTSSGCNIISLCADADQATKDRILPGERGAASVVVNALIRHSSAVHPSKEEFTGVGTIDDATVCAQAAQAVAALALNSTYAQATLGEAGAIAALLLALRFHRDRSIVLCRVVVVALSALCSDCVSNVESLHTQEGVDQVVRAARYTGDPALGIETCRAVAAWCEPGTDGSSRDWRCTQAGNTTLTFACAMLQVAVRRDANGSRSLPDQLAAAMGCNADESNVSQTVLTEITQHNEGPVSEELECGNQSYPDDTRRDDLQLMSEAKSVPEPEPEFGVHQLSTADYRWHDEFQNPDSSWHIQQHRIEVHSDMILETVDACSRALECLLQVEALRSLALAQEVLPLLIAALKTHVTHTSVSVSISRAVVSALGDRDHKAQKCLREEGGLHLLVELLRMGEYTIESRLDSASLRGLLAATSGFSQATKLTQHGVNARVIFRLEGPKVLYRILIVEARGGLQRSAQLTLKVVVNLALQAEPEEVHAMNDAGLISGIYHVMQRHATSGKLLGLACRALVCLHSQLWEETKEQCEHFLLAKNAALELLRQALPRHLDDRRLQKYGMQVLGVVATRPQLMLAEAEPPKPGPAEVETRSEQLESEQRMPREPASAEVEATLDQPGPALADVEPEPEPEQEPHEQPEPAMAELEATSEQPEAALAEVEPIPEPQSTPKSTSEPECTPRLQPEPHEQPEFALAEAEAAPDQPGLLSSELHATPEQPESEQREQSGLVSAEVEAAPEQSALEQRKQPALASAQVEDATTEQPKIEQPEMEQREQPGLHRP